MGILLGLAALVIPIAQIWQLSKGRKGLGHFAPVLSLGACGLTVWNMLRSYGQRIAHHDWSGLEDTYEAVNGIALTLLVITFLLNLFLAWAERGFDLERKEDQNQNI